MAFSEFEFRTQSWFDQDGFESFHDAIPMKTLVVHCFDPRATEIPQAVAAHLGDETYPGENILDEAGNRVGHTRTVFALSNAGGRAAAALDAVALMDYLFQVRNVAVVHHSFCGETALTADHLFRRFRDRHAVDISGLFEPEDLAISDFEESLAHDVALLRASPAVPEHVNLYGFFYEINSGALTEITRNTGT